MLNANEYLISRMTNDNDIAPKFKATIRLIFGRIIVLVICIRPNSKDPVYNTALYIVDNRGTKHSQNYPLSFIQSTKLRYCLLEEGEMEHNQCQISEN